MTLVCCALLHPHWGGIKVWMQLVIFILRKLTFNIQPNLQPLTHWATITATTGGLGYGLGGFGGLGYGYGSSYGLGGYDGYGCGYFCPSFYGWYLSSGFFWKTWSLFWDSECLCNFYYLLLFFKDVITLHLEIFGSADTHVSDEWFECSTKI